GAGLESLILGCTHYPLAAPLIGTLMGPGVTLVDSGAEAARALARLLRERGQLAAGPPQHHFYLSDERLDFVRVAEALPGARPPAHTVGGPARLPWLRAPAGAGGGGGGPRSPAAIRASEASGRAPEPFQRHDARSPRQPRRLTLERGVLPHAEGSCLVTL